jgi:hypothetical protein
MAHCEWRAVEHSKLALKRRDIHFAMIVLSAADIAFGGAKFFVLIGGAAFATPLGVWCDEPTVGLTFRSKS